MIINFKHILNYNNKLKDLLSEKYKEYSIQYKKPRKNIDLSKEILFSWERYSKNIPSYISKNILKKIEDENIYLKHKILRK